MKVGIRKPSYKKSFSAKTKGRATRSIKKLTSPGYGKKGMGVIKNPSKSLYNYTYNRTTTSLYKKSSSKSTSSSYKPRKTKLYKPSSYKTSTTCYKPSTSTNKLKSNHSSYYNYDKNITLSSNHSNINNKAFIQREQEYIEYEQEFGLYIEDVTSAYEMNYTQTLEEGYHPLKLNHSEFELKNMQSENLTTDSFRSLNKSITNKKQKTKTKDDLPYIKKKKQDYYTLGPQFETSNPKGYVEFEGLTFIGDEFFYYNRYDFDANVSSLYSLLSYRDNLRADFELKNEDNQFHIYAYYEYENKLKVGHIGFIASDEFNSQLGLCTDLRIQVYEMFLDKPRFKIYVKKDDYKEIQKYREESKKNSEIREELFNNRSQNEEVAYQFVIHGVDCENKSYLLDAILNYEKAIEIGYSVPFVYERLFLIYKSKNDYENAIRVLSKGIDDLKLINEFNPINPLDYKIGCFEKSLKEAKSYLINKSIKPNLHKKEKGSFFNFLNIFKNLQSPLDSTTSIKKESTRLIKPLKYVDKDILGDKFYTFKPQGYTVYDNIARYGHDIYYYNDFYYQHFCTNKKVIDEKRLSLFEQKLRYDNNISMDFEFEDRDDCIYINSYFYHNNNIVKCEIGFINNEEITKELRAYEDIKVFLESYDNDNIGFKIYVK